jgi:hypothetical protein
MATLPDLSEYGLSVTPYEGLSEIARTFGANAYFGPADYIAARQAGYNDNQIASYLKANPYMMNPSTLANGGQGILGQILAGQGDQIIATGTPNLAAYDPNRPAITNPNAPSNAIPYAQMGIPGRGNDPSVQMYGSNVDVAGNDTYNQLMQASQAGTLVMVKAPSQNTNPFAPNYGASGYNLIDSATGNVVANNVSPTQTNGVYQFSFANPQSEGSINTYIRADPTTGVVGAIDPTKQMTYQSGAGGGMLSGIAQMALPVLAGLALPGIGAAVGDALGLGSGSLVSGALQGLGIAQPAADAVAAGLSQAQTAANIAQGIQQIASGNPQGAVGNILSLATGLGGGSTPSSTAALSPDQVGALTNISPSADQLPTTDFPGTPAPTVDTGGLPTTDFPSGSVTAPISNADQAASMGSMANIGTPYQGQGAISGANALDPTTAYLNTFDLTNPSAEASTGTTTSYGGGLGQSFYNVPTTPVSQQQPGVPTTYTSVPVSSGYALTPDITMPSAASIGSVSPTATAATPASSGSTAQSFFNQVINQAAQNTPSDKTGRTLLTPTMFTGQAPSQQQNILSPLAQLQLALSGYQPALTKAVRQRMARGGQPHPYHPEAKPGEPIFRTGGPSHYVQGKGTGQSDDIPAMLADGEYVFDADTVSQLGDGSNKAGAEKLDKFREALRRHKRSAPDDKIPPKAKKLTSYLKEAERG